MVYVKLNPSFGTKRNMVFAREMCFADRYTMQLRRRYGAPIDRKRVYLIMVRRDVMRKDVSDFGDFVAQKLNDMKREPKTGWILTSILVWNFHQLQYNCVHGLLPGLTQD